MNKEKRALAYWLNQIAGEMQNASNRMKTIYGDSHENLEELFGASLMMKDWAEEIKKDAKKA